MKQYGRFIALGGSIALSLICTLTLGSRKAVVQVQQFDRFAQWCENRSELTEAARHTVEMLLVLVETQDCQIADERLADLTTLYLRYKRISDIRPLSSLTHLTTLYLWDNQIVDVSPLSSLTNLNWIFLSGNPITDRTCPLEPPSNCYFE